MLPSFWSIFKGLSGNFFFQFFFYLTKWPKYFFFRFFDRPKIDFKTSQITQFTLDHKQSMSRILNIGGYSVHYLPKRHQYTSTTFLDLSYKGKFKNILNVLQTSKVMGIWSYNENVLVSPFLFKMSNPHNFWTVKVWKKFKIFLN